MLLGYSYAITVIITFIAQSQLNIKLNNELYKDKYIETEKPRKVGFKETAINTLKFLLPVYNIVSSIYNLNKFDKYYEKEKNKMLEKGYLEKVVVKENVLEEGILEQKKTNEVNLVEDNNIKTFEWGNDLSEEIEYIRPKQMIKTMKR